MVSQFAERIDDQRSPAPGGFAPVGAGGEKSADAGQRSARASAAISRQESFNNTLSYTEIVSMFEEIMQHGPPYPVVVVSSGFYVVHDDKGRSSPKRPLFRVVRERALWYRSHFSRQPHWNYFGDCEVGLGGGGGSFVLLLISLNISCSSHLLRWALCWSRWHWRMASFSTRPRRASASPCALSRTQVGDVGVVARCACLVAVLLWSISPHDALIFYSPQHHPGL